MSDTYRNQVVLRYNAFNNLFLDLPFGGTYETGIYLPLLAKSCESGFSDGKSPEQIINTFFDEYFDKLDEKDRMALLFRFIQYVEREIVLFDAIEDASFAKLHKNDTSGTLSSLIGRVAETGKTQELIEKLRDFSVRIVLTAHPTQFYPSQVLGIITDLTRAIKANKLNEVNDLLHQLGKTPFFQKKKPSPFDEAVRLTWYLENVFYYAIPSLISQLCKDLKIDPVEWPNVDLLKVGFWPGGDRDGNPFVTAEITLQVAERLKEIILKAYHRDIKILRRRLTFRGVEEIIVKAEKLLYNAAFKPKKKKFENSEELLNCLLEARDNLKEYHNSLYIDQLDLLILKVKIFGFYLSSLDIRQDSRKHRAYWQSLTGSTDLTIDNVLSQAIPDPVESNKEEVQEWINTIKAIRSIQQSNGEKACNRFIISNAKDELDVLIIYKMAKELIGTEQGLSLDIIPLFESIDDLANSASVMKSLFDLPEYREHLSRRNDQQTIMLGFSDGTKDGGYLRANWSILRAKETLTQVAREAGIKIIFFDGRGGPPARGGGNTHKFYASQGDKVDTHEIQLTIQGQTVSANYGQVDSCIYNLEQLLTAGIEGSLFLNDQTNLSDSERQVMDMLADLGYEKYKDLKGHERFVSYLEKMTPLNFFADTNIGSRPSRRGGKGELTLGDLRAIPFVGSWGQMKQNVPAFYGVGTALETLENKGMASELSDFYSRSLFFRTLLGNTMQSLEKANFEATRYIHNDPEFGEFWDNLFSEYERTRNQILSLTGSSQLMEENPDIRSSIRTREKIVLPLVTIQQYGLQKFREQPENDSFRKLVIRTMFGIINAARNAA